MPSIRGDDRGLAVWPWAADLRRVPSAGLRDGGHPLRKDPQTAPFVDWQYLPELFDWSADRNMNPCPLQGTYQLARNVLAACVQPDGTVDANSGHALVIYDDRNPAFLPGGEAARQWEAATGALVRRSRLRRCSWQRLVAQLATDPDLAWLVNGLAAKYVRPSQGPEISRAPVWGAVFTHQRRPELSTMRWRGSLAGTR